MSIIVIGGIKGGSGKTTLATNFTYISSMFDRMRTMLVDADEQKSALDWVEQRLSNESIETPWTTVHLSGPALRTELLKLRKNFDRIFVDVGGRDTTSQRAALTVADYFITPFQPRSFDIWTIGGVSNLIKEIKLVNPALKCCGVLNRADSRGMDNAQAMDILNEYSEITSIPLMLVSRKVYANAAANGLSIFEHKPADQSAMKELMDVYNTILVPSYTTVVSKGKK